MSDHGAGSGGYRWLTDFGVRAARRFVQIEGAQQATVLAAQAFTSLIPFLVVGAAFGPGDGDLADRIVERFGLEGKSADSVEALFNSSGDVTSAITWVGVIILILATLSFSRAMHKMSSGRIRFRPRAARPLARLRMAGRFRRLDRALGAAARDVPGRGRPLALGGHHHGHRRGAVAGHPAHPAGHDRVAPADPGGARLGRARGDSERASAIYVPILMTWSADRYGLIGIAFSIQSWLVVIGFRDRDRGGEWGGRERAVR